MVFLKFPSLTRIAGGVLLGALLLSTSSCLEILDGFLANSFFNVDGERFPLEMGYVQNFGLNLPAQDSYDFDLTLSSQELFFDDALGRFVGEGNALILDLNSPQETLQEGTYPFKSGPRAPFVLSDARLFIQGSLSEGVFEEEYEIISGEVEVLESNGSIRLEFSFQMLRLGSTSSVAVFGSFGNVLVEID